MSENPPPQFGLRTLLLIVTAVAVVCSLTAWCGLTGSAGIIALLLVFAAAGGAFIGLLICAYSGLGFGLGVLRWEIARCLAFAVIGALTIYGAASLASVFPGAAALPLIALFSIKVLWRDIELAEMLIVLFSAVSLAGIVWTTARHWLGG